MSILATQAQALWRERPLTAAEKRIAEACFGAALPLSPIRLARAGAAPGRFAVATPFNRVVFMARAGLPADFGVEPLRTQAWLVHELTHLWQACQGVPLMRAKLRALGRRAYAWRLAAGQAFRRYNIEQQAEMTAAAFLVLNGLVSHPDADRLHDAFGREALAGDAPAVFATRRSMPTPAST